MELNEEVILDRKRGLRASFLFDDLTLFYHYSSKKGLCLRHVHQEILNVWKNPSTTDAY